MAKKQNKKGKSPKPQGSENEGKKRAVPGAAYGFLTVIIALLVIAGIFAGAFYYVVKNDIQGVGEKYRGVLQGIPVLKYALPPLPESEDPNDPKYLTYSELIEKYNALRAENKGLQDRLDQIDNRDAVTVGTQTELTKGLEKNQQVLDDIQKEKEVIEKAQEEMTARQDQLEKDTETFKTLIANGDKDAFIEYYKQVDPETAQKIYEEVIAGQQTDKEMKSFVARYEQMDPSSAAKLMETLGGTDMELVVDIVHNMNTSAAAEVIQAMNATFGADVTRKIADRIKTGR